jgi:diguanylate cyclase (GGDEF)-like protein
MPVSPRDVARRPAPLLNKLQLDQHLQRLAALAEAELVADSRAAAFSRIIDAVARLLPASAGASIVLWDPVRRRFTTGASNVAGQSGATPVQRVRRQGGSTRWIIDNQESLAVADVTADPFGVNPMTVDHDIRAYLGAPIVLQGESLGVVYALSHEARDWAETDVLFVETMARRAAMAIYNTDLIRDAREARDRAEALGRVGNALIGRADTGLLPEIVAGVVDGLRADRALLVTFDGAEQQLVDHVVGGPGADRMTRASFADLMDGLTGEALRTGEPILSPGGTADEREAPYLRDRREASGAGPVVVAPLRVGDCCAGSLTAIRRAGEPDFTDEDADLIRAIGAQAAVALEHARLIAESQRSAARVAALYRVMEAINSEVGLDELLARLTDVVADTLEADRVALALLDVTHRTVRRVVSGGPGRHWVVADVTFDELWEGLTGWVMRNRRPALSLQDEDDARESMRVKERRRTTVTGSILVVPLFHRGAQLGTLTVMNQPGQPDFTREHVEVAAAMAGHIAVAVANADLMDELQRLAVTDELTGTWNRRHVFEAADREVRLSRRSGAPVSVVLFDIDDFKQVNDRLGHGAGDDVLAGVAARAADVIRDVDVLGRYGGEEFVIVLPGSDAAGSATTAERIRAAVSADPIPTRAGEVTVTISAGAVQLAPGMSGVDHLLDRADAAMYLAKRMGKDRVEVG